MRNNIKARIEQLESQRQGPDAPKESANRPGRGPPRFTGPLESVADARRLLSTIIVQCTNGVRDTGQGSKLAFMLTQYVALVANDTFEARLASVEAQLGNAPAKPL